MAGGIAVQIILIILAGIIAARVARRLGVPEILPLLLAGYLLGSDVFNLLRPSDLGINLEMLAIIAIPIILFYEGIKADPKILFSSIGVVISFTTIAVFITVIGVALFCFFFLGMPLILGLLLGAVLGSTDPASIIPVLRKLNVSKKISSILEAETAFNDATVISLFLIFLGAVTGVLFSPQEIFIKFIFIMLVSVAVGVLIGFVANGILSRFRVEQHLVLASIVLLLISFLVAEGIGASGAIASVVVAMVLGIHLRSSRIDSISRLYTLDAWEDLNFLAIALIFLSLGASIQVSSLLPFLVPGILLSLAFIFVIRPLTVLISAGFSKDFSWRDRLFISWVGSPRGTVSAGLAAIVLSKASDGLLSFSQANSVFSITVVVVLATISVTTLSATFMAKRLLGVSYNESVERYRSMNAELKALKVAYRHLSDEWKRGLVSNRVYKEIGTKYEELIEKTEKEIEKLVKKEPSLEYKERASKIRELLAVQINSVEEAYDNKEISEVSYNELIEKYNRLMSRLSELEEERI